MNNTPEKPVIVRLPPSPTGYLHIGNLRTMVFNYLFAQKHNGKVILRIEDTDQARSKREYEDYLVESLDWLSITYDEHYRQSDRTPIYREHLERLIAEDKAYISKEEHSAEDLAAAHAAGKTLRDEVIRFRNPNKKITFTDIVLGDISVDTSDLGDFVIAKDLDNPIYHLTVTVDDYLMGITHVIRGNDHVANTPRQIVLLEALGAERPHYAHIPLVLGTDGKKLSKRHAATATLDYREAGFLPEAMLNFLSLLGWNPGTEQEIFSREELIQAFSLERIQKGGAVFNEEKLRWVNRQHLLGLSTEEQFALAKPHLEGIEDYNEDIAQRIIPQIFERIDTLGDIARDAQAGEYAYYFSTPEYTDPEKLIWKKSSASDAKKHLETALELLTVQTSWTHETLKESLWPYAEQEGRGDVLWPLRFALSGKDKSPDPFILLEILEKDESLERIKRAITTLDAMI